MVKREDGPEELLDFDAWFKRENFGISFDEEYMQPMMDVQVAQKAMLRAMRDYATYAARAAR